MKNSEKNDPVWKLLGAARRVEADPFFSRNVVREVRQLQSEQSEQADGADRPGVFEGILSFFRQPALAGVAAAIAVLVVVFISTDPGADPLVTQTFPSVEAADAALTEEIESIGYLGELMTVSDPTELDDAALAELYVLASR